MDVLWLIFEAKLRNHTWSNLRSDPADDEIQAMRQYLYGMDPGRTEHLWLSYCPWANEEVPC